MAPPMSVYWNHLTRIFNGVLVMDVTKKGQTAFPSLPLQYIRPEVTKHEPSHGGAPIHPR